MDVVLQMGCQTYAHRLCLYAANPRLLVFPKGGGFGEEAEELGPRSDHYGPCLILLKRCTASRQDFIHLIETTFLNRVCVELRYIVRVYWCGFHAESRNGMASHVRTLLRPFLSDGDVENSTDFSEKITFDNMEGEGKKLCESEEEISDQKLAKCQELDSDLSSTNGCLPGGSVQSTEVGGPFDGGREAEGRNHGGENGSFGNSDKSKAELRKFTNPMLRNRGKGKYSREGGRKLRDERVEGDEGERERAVSGSGRISSSRWRSFSRGRENGVEGSTTTGTETELNHGNGHKFGHQEEENSPSLQISETPIDPQTAINPKNLQSLQNLQNLKISEISETLNGTKGSNLRLRLQTFPRELAEWLIDELPLVDFQPRAFTHTLNVVEAEGGVRYGLTRGVDTWLHANDRAGRAEGCASRAVCKLEEALQVEGVELNDRMTVVDVGAAPGAWTEFLAARVARVAAVDPAKLSASVLKPNVLHIQKKVEDGLEDLSQWRGGAPCDLLTCDVNKHPLQAARMLRPLLPALRPGGRLIMTMKYNGRGREKAGGVLAEVRAIFGEELAGGGAVWLMANTLFERTFVGVKN